MSSPAGTSGPGFPVNRAWEAWQNSVKYGEMIVYTQAGVSDLQPAGHRQPRRAVKVAQHKIANLLKTLRFIFVIMCHNVFNVWPKTTLLPPVWPRDAKRLDTLLQGKGGNYAPGLEVLSKI